MTDWNARWMDRAKHLAAWSKDPSTKVGCVLVKDQHAVAEGFNGFPHGVNDSDGRLQVRDVKLDWTIHAEANAIAHAARYGHNTSGAAAYVTFPTCPSCATLLIQAGVRVVVVLVPKCQHCVGGLAKADVPGFHSYRSRTTNGAPVDTLLRCELRDSDNTWMTRYAISKQIFREAGVAVLEL